MWKISNFISGFYLSSVFGHGLVDQMHEKEHVVGEIVLTHRVYLEAVRGLVKVVVANVAYKASRLQALLHLLQLISQLTESIDNQT